MTPLETYLRELCEIRSTGAGVEEESYYHPLATLLNELGKKLKPKVKCVLQLANRGAGKPDGGLFTSDQFERVSDAVPLPGQLPARGAIEIKPAKNDAWITAEAKQVTKYWNRYRQVLVTNYRDFVLVGQDLDGNAAILETYRLAENEKSFWAAAAAPRSTAEKQDDRFVEYLQRVMRHAAQIASPEDVAWFLASYARDALASIHDVELSALAAVRSALEEALGLKFEGGKGEHFFRSSLVQTLFYGIFSAWVLWSRHNPPAGGAAVPAAGEGRESQRDAGAARRFDWRLTAWSLRVPMISRLFSLVADPHQLDALKLSEVLDWTGAVLNRVDRASFFSKFEESHAVQYFYEPFLEAFDPELRKQLGVWYTPPEIVKYMVERVDTVLCQELGLALGLADKNVYVLDPCCGTGSYLVEVLDRIHRTLKERGEDALTASDLKEAAQKRVFGFEILPAPFVVSHLQLGLLLQKLGAPLAENRQERVAVYLTNALTGWEPPKGPKQHLIFKEMEEERDAAENVKQQTKILVILGNPPYNGFAGVAVAEERILTDAYRTTNRAPAPQGQGLNDLYVRFYRMAERRIVEMTKRGVVCFISNYSWLDGLSFTGMRERYLDVFDRVWIDNLHGDRIISEYAPDGRTSETVFAVQGKSPGIKIGTAVGLLARSRDSSKPDGKMILYRDVDQARAAERTAALVGSLTEPNINESYTLLEPVLQLGLPFKPRLLDDAYVSWPLLPELFPVFFAGVNTKRDDLVIDIDRSRLVERMEKYFDPDVSHDEMKRICPRAMQPTARFQARPVREYLQTRGFMRGNIFRHVYRPFDLRWLYYEHETRLLGERSPDYFPHAFDGNVWIVSQQKPRRDWSRPQFIRSLGSLDLMDRGASCVPLRLRPGEQGGTLLPAEERQEPRTLPDGSSFNASDALLRYLSAAAEDRDAPEAFYHALAILHSPLYHSENAGALRQDWPRIPLPDSKYLLLASAALGRKIAALLDTETPLDDVAAPLYERGPEVASHSPALQKIAVPTRVDGKPLDEAKDLAVTAGWGHTGKGGVTMPGKGSLIERDCTPKERESLLGDRTCDVYLNEVAYWKNIPIRVWEYTIGGYQVIKKWLSYREERLLGRPMAKDEVRWVQEMARRIAAILLLEPALDDNYRAVKAHAYNWPEVDRPIPSADNGR